MEALNMAFEKLENLSEDATTDEVEQVKIEVKDFFIGDIDIKREEEEWINFMKGKMELSMGYMTSDKDSLIEIFQRRNLFIHKGIINRIYIAKVKKEYQYEGEMG